MPVTIDNETEPALDWMTETIEFNNVTSVSRHLVTVNVPLVSATIIPNYSTGSTSIGISKNNWSTAYTLDQELIDRLCVSKSMNTTNIDLRPVHLYFNRSLTNENKFETETIRDIADTLPTRIIYCTNWAELSENIKSCPRTICFHVSELEHSSAIEIVNMVNTLVKLVEIKDPISITVSIKDDTSLQTVRDLQKSEIFGIIPGTLSFGKEETLKGLNAQWNKIPYWPKHILEQLPGAKKTIRVKTDEIKLTPRQEQILFLIRERGSSNKVIAKTLNITESTVKLHVGLVLKKFGVKNRTQLAVFSKK